MAESSEVQQNPGGSIGLQCISGFVTVFPPVGVGAILGQITPRLGTPVQLRQVVGPAGGPVPLTQVDRQFATVCGVFVLEDTRVFLDVRLVIPEPTPPPPPPFDFTLLLILIVLVLALAPLH